MIYRGCAEVGYERSMAVIYKGDEGQDWGRTYKYFVHSYRKDNHITPTLSLIV